MKVLSLFTSVLAGVSVASALYAPPRKLYRRQSSDAQNSTSSSSGISAGSFTPNGTNSTQPQVFFAGNDHQNVTNKTSQNIFNVTGTLDITQLYDVASRVNSTLQNSTQGIVIVADPGSIESLSFFSSILFSTNSTVVVCPDPQLGSIVASSSQAAFRGPLTVSQDRKIYAGGLQPWGVPVGVIDKNDQTHWYYSAAQPLLTSPDSKIRTQYPNFTNPHLTKDILVPIIYEVGSIKAFTGTSRPSVDGLVVVSSGSSNVTEAANSTTALGNTTVPIVFAGQSADLGYVTNSTLPQSAISAGFLTPVQAQILLSIAINNGVNSTTSLKNVFP